MVLRKSFYIRWSAGRSPRVHEVNPSRDPSSRQSNRIIQTKVMAFSCQLVILPIFLVTICITHFSGVLTSYFDTMSSYSFKSKVLRVLFQLESPNSKHRNSSYVQNNRANLCSKTEPEFVLHMSLL